MFCNISVNNTCPPENHIWNELFMSMKNLLQWWWPTGDEWREHDQRWVTMVFYMLHTLTSTNLMTSSNGLGMSFRTHIILSKCFCAIFLTCSRSFSVNLLGICIVFLANGLWTRISQKTLKSVDDKM